jgi:hypothetical protein
VCEKSGPRLVDEGEILYRQVHPNWFDAGVPTSQGFRPGTGDDCPSVDRSSLTTPQRSYQLFTDPKPFGFAGTSEGVWGVSVEEVDNAGIEAWASPVAATTDTPANPAHAVLDFLNHGRNPSGRIGRVLRDAAVRRKRLYP